LKKRVRWVGEERRSMSEENVNIMRQGYEAFNRGDIEAVTSIMDPNIEWQEPDVEGLPARGTHHGPEALVNNVIGPVVETWDDFQAVAEEFLDAGERVIVLGRFRGRGKESGRTFEAPFAHVWTLRDRKAVHHRNYPDTATLLQSLG
jgi:ketosteroid isomerase-like protein